MLHFDLDVREFNKSFQIINGHISTDMTLDNDVALTVTGMEMEDERWITDKTYIEEGKLCKTLNAILSLSDSAGVLLENVCPISAGSHHIENFPADAFGVLFGNEMHGFRKLQVELKHQNDVISCYVVNAVLY